MAQLEFHLTSLMDVGEDAPEWIPAEFGIRLRVGDNDIEITPGTGGELVLTRKGSGGQALLIQPEAHNRITIPRVPE